MNLVQVLESLKRDPATADGIVTGKPFRPAPPRPALS